MQMGRGFQNATIVYVKENGYNFFLYMIKDEGINYLKNANLTKKIKYCKIKNRQKKNFFFLNIYRNR